MRKSVFTFLFTLLVLAIQAQNPGDTIKVRTFHYGSNNRDTLAVFPSEVFTFEKIIMKYSMRCKNGLVSDQTNRNQGCGEWDYSCNTYIVDSTKIEEALSTQPNYVITNFSGTVFPYTTKAVYDYYRFTQKKVVTDSINNETTYALLNGTSNLSLVLNTEMNSGKTQILFTAAELIAAGFTAGPINSLRLEALTASNANFFKVRIKHSDALNLRSGKAEINGFTEVFTNHFAFKNGVNLIPFHTNFSWNGTQSLLIEFSYTNAQAQAPLSLLGQTDTTGMALYSNNNYAADLANNGHVILDTNLFSSIKNELSIAFWAYGNAAQMPFSNSILYGTDANVNNRQLNIHLPHGSNNIYFDCGFAAGGYDRINKLSTPQEQGGRWNHWTFTKNASTGMMRIYLNGVLWLEGSGKTKPITLMNLILGKDNSLNNNFKGRVNDLAIWNKEVNDSFIKDVMQLPLLTIQNNRSNLVAYYPFNEAAGQQVKERVSSKEISGNNLGWTYDRGESLSRSFLVSSGRPNIKLGRGDYYTRTITEYALDSVKRNTNSVTSYSITSKAAEVPMTNDVVNQLGTNNTLYLANYSKVYNGDFDSMPMIDSMANAAEGTYTLTNLNYYKRYPWYNEIMSFVTPYGIGLNLGPAGKSWYFDVTDFAPLLKGNKRIMMTLGGQTQEQNDIEFWFVVGAPPRTVLEFNQIWQGTNRTGSAALTAINNESRFSPVTVPILSGGKAFKIRSSITGHGAEGEFEANGGSVNHMLNINGGDTDFVWSIVVPCAGNPVYPQGGTWVYDRQGWCPGQSSLLKEHNLTGKLVPGTPAIIDYLASKPNKAGGAYNYQVAHQLVTYGAPNYTLDARIMEVISPSDKILNGRVNPVCAAPKVVVQNSGSQAITQITFDYWINADGAVQSYTWTGNLASMGSTTLSLPVKSLWNKGMLSSGNQFYVEIKKVNNQTDGYALNNRFISAFNKPEIVPSVFTLEFYTNNNPTENSFMILDEYGAIIDSQSFTKPNTLFTKNYNLGGCYKIVVKDLGEDGLAWWANPDQGTGYMRIKRANGSVLKTFQNDFGMGFEYSFTTNWALATEELSFGTLISLYPNPNTGSFTLDGEDLDQAEIKMTDLEGRDLQVPMKKIGHQKYEVQAAQITPGIYLVQIEKGGQRTCKKVWVQ